VERKERPPLFIIRNVKTLIWLGIEEERGDKGQEWIRWR